jgi:NAD(P)-dependent dehydrogenase (short-subunit alcohol dehydrogenase family)
MAPSTRPPVVVITGASSGIARATAIAFAGRGASVVHAARHPGTAAAVLRHRRATPPVVRRVPFSF